MIFFHFFSFQNLIQGVILIYDVVYSYLHRWRYSHFFLIQDCTWQVLLLHIPFFCNLQWIKCIKDIRKTLKWSTNVSFLLLPTGSTDIWIYSNIFTTFFLVLNLNCCLPYMLQWLLPYYHSWQFKYTCMFLLENNFNQIKNVPIYRQICT